MRYQSPNGSQIGTNVLNAMLVRLLPNVSPSKLTHLWKDHLLNLSLHISDASHQTQPALVSTCSAKLTIA